ncbi:glutamate--tRNA ligase [Candidatus Woesearchaeota archaeon]|nr:glutamate--tRNA ligase [Candidatus Woesearchaeota archaeon]
MDKKELESLAKSLALENAVKFKGKANPGAVIGPLMKIFKGFNPKEHAKIINEVVREVNSYSPDKQKKLFEEQGSVKEKKETKKSELPSLRNAEEGKVVTRMAPEPSKYNHVGHALSFLINYLYAKMYKGKCFLRFDDTNPEREEQEFVDAIQIDVVYYLDINPDKTIFASDHMDVYYSYAEKLINDDKSYVCFCTKEQTSAKRRAMKDCEHRGFDTRKNLGLWSQMRKGDFKEGECTLRLKIDMKHKNAVMRDPSIFRINKTSHYRQKKKYLIWPLYDFESAIEDGLNKVTHVLRSNEFESRIELQHYIADLFSFRHIEFKQYGRFNITGAITQGREIREKILAKEFLGWDDPRLVTLRALRKRGVVKETLVELSKIAGLSKQQTNIDYSVIASINRRILDNSSDRFFFIEDPVEIVIEGAPNLDVELDLHPDRKGGRKMSTEDVFLVEKKDYDSIKIGVIYRLMDCLNFKKTKTGFVFVSKYYDDYKKQKGKGIIHWLPKKSDELIKAEILMDDVSVKNGFVEKNIKKAKLDSVVQFERFGFVRLDEVRSNVYKFVYAHK